MPPQFRVYDQRTTPQGPRMPTLRPVDTQTGIGAAVARAGAQLEQAAEYRQRREEEDGRLHAARAVAQYRARANAARREAFEKAPDGFRGVTEATQARLRELREEFSRAAGEVSPSAQLFVEQSIDTEDPLFVEETIGQENAARSRWQADTARSAVKESSSVVAADPRQYEPLRAQQLEALSGIQDADLKRDLTALVEEELSVSAVSGMVERDPAGALRLLRDPESGGPVARLSGPQRNSMENRAQAELNRREAEARARQAQAVASLRDTVSAQRDNARRGIMPSNPVPLDQVARALGPDVAQAYAYDIQGAMVQQGLVATPSAQVAQAGVIAPQAQASDFERGLAQVTRDAAGEVLKQRNDDPGGYGVRNGLFRHDDLMSRIGQAVQSGDWTAAQQALRDRGADAVEARRSGVLPRVAPFSKAEASALSTFIEQQPANGRLALFSQLSASMPREAYQGAMQQLAPNHPVTAYAGALAPRRGPGFDGAREARIFLRGEEVLRGRVGETGARTPALTMPQEDRLRQAWAGIVGNAYEGEALAPVAERAYQAFRAHYAGQTEAVGDASGTVDNERARRAAAMSTGGIINWSGRRTVIPLGMSERQFGAAVRGQIGQYRDRLPDRAENYDLRLVSPGRYAVYSGDTPERDSLGRPIVIGVTGR